MAVVVALKYCERCGGIWLRPTENSNVLCDHCTEATRANPFADSSWRRYLRRKNSAWDSQLFVDVQPDPIEKDEFDEFEAAFQAGCYA